MTKFTHLNDRGEAQMVDITSKDSTSRSALARAEVTMKPETLTMISEGGHKKGDVLGVARIAGIQAAKKTADLIPLCHPLMLTSIKVEIELDTANNKAIIDASARLAGKTGVEMEALTAASVAALTLYDMCKAFDRGMVISGVRLIEKVGGKSGHWQAGVS